MKVINTGIKGLLLLEPSVYGDKRGYFLESWNKNTFCRAVGHDVSFVQDNHSVSSKGILRGLHIQVGKEQGKLVRVSKGSVIDVAVDLRQGSETYGEFFLVELSGTNNKQLWIPRGFAHGFLTLEDDTHFQYKCDDYYDSSSEVSLKWDDLELGIPWSDYLALSVPKLSDKDERGISLVEFKKITS